MTDLRSAVEALVVRILGPRLDYLARYPARVVSQRADGTLDLVPDDARVPSCAGVPYRSLPGVALSVPAGARVLLGYAGGDPARPFAELWEPGDVTRLTVAGGTHAAAREGHAVTVTIPALTITAADGTPNAAPITLSGHITEGTDVLHLP